MPAAIVFFMSNVRTAATARYAVSGLILNIDRPHRTFVASCSAVPDYMKAMVMPIPVHDAKALEGLRPGMLWTLRWWCENNRSYAENVKVHQFESLAREPLLSSPVGNACQTRQRETFACAGDHRRAGSGFRVHGPDRSATAAFAVPGKVVAVAFVYTSCPLPEHSFRLSNNFGRVQKRFAGRMGRDLVLLSISFDPVHDQPEVLAKYAGIWKADPRFVALFDRNARGREIDKPPLRCELLAG